MPLSNDAGYPVVKFVGSNQEKVTTNFTQNGICYHGVPEVVEWEYGLPFNSHKFKVQVRKEEFEHRKVTIGWPEVKAM